MQGSEPAFPGYKRETKIVERRHPMLPPPGGPQEVEVNTPVPGMSTRLYVAAKVLAGWSETDHRLCADLSNSTQYTIRDRADYAMAQADALIAACKENA